MLDRAYGCLIGAAIGDAMGMPASFMTPQQIEKSYGRISGFNKPSAAQVAHGMLTAGAITDDTEESLLIASVLIEHSGFSRALFVTKMKEWAINNNMLASTVIGPSTRRFLTAIIEGSDYLEAAKIGDTNGGAMRVAPIGIYYHGDIHQAVRAACESALVSHGSKPGVSSTCAVAAAVACAMAGDRNINEVMEAALYGARFGEAQGYDLPAPSVEARIRLAMETVDRHAGKSMAELGNLLYRLIGAGMKSYESIPLSLGVFYAGQGHFEECLLAIINIGDDADTNGAIVGALCGAFGGAAAIKPEWKEYIQAVNHIDLAKLAAQLIGQA